MQRVKWFDKDIVSRLDIWEGSIIKGIPVTNIKPEDREKVKNTILYIQEHFDHICQAMLEALLPTLTQWKMQDYKTKELVTTIRQLHETHETEVIADMEAGCILCLRAACPKVAYAYSLSKAETLRATQKWGLICRKK